MEIQEIKKGFCPKCNCEIANFDEKGRVKEKNSLYTEFWVKYDDGGNANFAICKFCIKDLTMEDVLIIHKRQKYTWGIEIIGTPLGILDFIAQLKWYISTAALLDVIKFGKTKEEIE